MENDSVRSVGESTLVDLWIEGKFRAITVSRDAIDSFLKLSPDSANAFTDSDRVEFVRTHLAVIVKAASDQLRSKPGADTIVIDAGQLSGAPRAEGGERRRGDRRQGERRKRNLGPPAGIERRRS
jgi:hypothetical protein